MDWEAFVDAWKPAYYAGMDRVRKGEIPWTNVDDIHRAKLEELLVEFGVTGWPKGLRPDRQRPLVERLGLRVVALGNTATFITMIYLIAAPLGNLFDPVKRRGTGISQ